MSTREKLHRLYRTSGIPEARREMSRLYRQATAQRGIFHLYNQVDIASKSLSNVLQDTLEGRITPEERAWIEKINAHWKELASLATEISFTDYGAGSSDRNLSKDEMFQGRVFTRTVGDIIRTTGTRTKCSALLLFKLIRPFKPLVCLELGTNLGFSACYPSAALKLNGAGELVTIEGAEPIASIARQNFKELGIDNVSVIVGRFQDTLGGVLNKIRSIDYAFIDGHHDEKATLSYFEQIHPFLSKRAVLIFDDIRWSKGMTRAWREIKADGRIGISVDLLNIGVCVVDCEIQRKQRLDFSWERRVLN